MVDPQNPSHKTSSPATAAQLRSTNPFSQSQFAFPQIPGQYLHPNIPFTAMRYPYLAPIHAPLYVTIHLHSKNFLMWESQIINLIDSQGCMGFVDGSISAPSTLILGSTSDGTHEQFVSNSDFLA